MCVCVCVCVSMPLFVSLLSCGDNLRAWLMAVLQVQTKLSSNEPGVCPPDLRGAATANKTHKDARPWHWPSPRLPAVLPLPHTAACCFVPAPRRGSSPHLLFKVALPPMPLFHTGRVERVHTDTHTHTNKHTHTCKLERHANYTLFKVTQFICFCFFSLSFVNEFLF